MPVHDRDDESSGGRVTRIRRAEEGSPADDLICPITLELPWDPVTAEDGRIYERSAIEAHFVSRQGTSLQSPYTNQPMGNKLFPAVQIKNLIDGMVRIGTIQGELADKWKAKKMEQEQVQTWFKKAGEGDRDAMFELGRSFALGKNGLPQDYSKAFDWYKKAHNKGHCTATAKLGEYYIQGMGGAEKCAATGLLYLSMAAQQGSRFGAYMIAYYSYKERYFQPIEPDVVLYWLKKCVSGEGLNQDYLSEEDLKTARQLLGRIEA